MKKLGGLKAEKVIFLFSSRNILQDKQVLKSMFLLN